jgi:hypothetical protein
MNAIQFTTVVGSDGLIHPPEGVKLPEGKIEVSVRPQGSEMLETRARARSARYGLNWDTLPNEARAIVLDDLAHEDRGTVRPLPAPGAFKGSILFMAPDFDAPLEDMKEYME